MKLEYGSDVIVELMKRYGFRHCLLNPGNTTRGILDSILADPDQQIEVIDIPHEKVAVGMAHGYAKVSTTGRKPRRRGGVATKRGLSREQVCLIVAQDRHQQALAEVSGMGQPSATDIDQVLTPMLHKEAILCTDGSKPYRRYCQEAEIQHVPVDGKKRLRGSLYHLNNVNNWHKRFSP